MKKTTKRQMSPAELATLYKVAELNTEGRTSTCDFFVKTR
jgi:hypothetical protein